MSFIFLKKYAGWTLVILLSIAPVFIWFFQDLSLSRFLSINSFIESLAQIAGLAGMAMFSLVIILSARLKIFEKLFWGINGAYAVHHLFGGIAFSLLLFHPLLIAYNLTSVSFAAAGKFLFFFSFWPKNFGILALAVMIVSLGVTFYIKAILKYQRWKFLHQFMGLSFTFAFLHVFLIGSDVARNQNLKLYLFVLGIFAIIAFLYRAFFESYLVKTYGYIVENITSLPDKTAEIEFKPAKKEMKFSAGQFGFFKFYSKGVSKEIHPFSMSSAPSQPLKICVKESGDYTKNIKNLQKGDLVKIEGPYGQFNFRNYSNAKQVWIAGGIGITPFLSMARDLSEKDYGRKIDLYYSVKTADSFIFKDELNAISKTNEDFKVFFWVTDEKDFITAEKIAEGIFDFIEKDILICGPALMMSALKSQFLKIGMKKKQIHTEEFQL